MSINIINFVQNLRVENHEKICLAFTPVFIVMRNPKKLCLVEKINLCCSQISLLEIKFNLLIDFLSATDEYLSHHHRDFVFIAIILSTLCCIHIEGLQSLRKMQIYKQVIAILCLFRRKISLEYPVWCVIFWVQNRVLKCIDLGCSRDSWLYKSAFKGLE